MSGDRKTAIPCECGCSVVMVWEFEQWRDEKHHVCVDWSVSFAEGRLRNRLRAAWRIVRGKDPWMHSIVLYEDGIDQLRAVLTNGGAPPVASEDAKGA